MEVFEDFGVAGVGIVGGEGRGVVDVVGYALGGDGGPGRVGAGGVEGDEVGVGAGGGDEVVRVEVGHGRIRNGIYDHVEGDVEGRVGGGDGGGASAQPRERRGGEVRGSIVQGECCFECVCSCRNNKPATLLRVLRLVGNNWGGGRPGTVGLAT